MSESPLSPSPSGLERGLPSNHRRAVWAAFTHLESLLGDVESAARMDDGVSPFARLHPDLTPAQQRVILGYIRSLRGRLTAAAGELGLVSATAPIPASWSAQTTLNFVLVALEEMNAARLAGYGPLDPAVAERLERIAADCRHLVRRAVTYLAQRLGRDLDGRLATLAEAPLDLELLRAIERIVTSHGLVEFRGALEALIEQLERSWLEIAIFGRVGSGKSSLLNAVLGMPVLPVGVTPVTAVPTRIAWGAIPRAEIRFAEAPPAEIPVERLHQFVSEQGNPANRRLVTLALVELPSAALSTEVAFVDTPGLGSLATAGARESYAYLPRCDLGVLLLDSGGSPTPEDLDVLRLLYDSGIPAVVALSKADLLTAPDRDRLRDYVRRVILAELGIRPSVGFVSTMGRDAELTRSWFASEIEPLLARTRELREASAARKLAHLRSGVEAALRLELRRGTAAGDGPTRGTAAELDSRLVPAGLLEACQLRCRRLTDELVRSKAELLELIGRASAEVSAAGSAAVGDAARRTARDRMEACRAAVRDSVLRCRDELRARLPREDWSTTDTLASSIDLQVDLLLLPEVALPPDFAVAALPRVATRLLPRSALRGFVSRTVRRTLERSLYAVLSELANRLLAWSRTETARLGDRFDALAAPLRALEPEGRVWSTPVDRVVIETDLRTLLELPAEVPDDAVPATA